MQTQVQTVGNQPKKIKIIVMYKLPGKQTPQIKCREITKNHHHHHHPPWGKIQNKSFYNFKNILDSFQQKLWDMQRKTGKCSPYSRKRAVNRFWVSPNVVFSKDLKSAIIKMFKEFKETTFRRVKGKYDNDLTNKVISTMKQRL